MQAERHTDRHIGVLIALLNTSSRSKVIMSYLISTYCICVQICQ